MKTPLECINDSDNCFCDHTEEEDDWNQAVEDMLIIHINKPFNPREAYLKIADKLVKDTCQRVRDALGEEMKFDRDEYDLKEKEDRRMNKIYGYNHCHKQAHKVLDLISNK